MDGDLYYNSSAQHSMQLMAYSTDASVYQETPLAVALPKNTKDIKLLIDFANKYNTTIIPRAAGTSLAGQVVGNGIVADVSKYLTAIKEINVQEKWVRVEPGVIRDDLNFKLRSYGLMFGPETSTASRAMIGGMVGNNSCGLHSIVWGSVRDHLLEVKAVLSDGSEVIFKKEDIQDNDYTGLKKQIYQGVANLLSIERNKSLIQEQFPKSSIHRRNTGYALDALIKMQPFEQQGEPFNICKLIAGSEGTLAFITEVKLNLMELPPEQIAVVCVHTHSIEEALRANIIALRHEPTASELVDRYIMNFTKEHPEYSKYCFFIEGDPATILMVEFMGHQKETVVGRANNLIDNLKQSGYGYSFPVLFNDDTKYAWDVRKAGLGLLRNLPGDKQPVNLIEDCAVAPAELPEYIKDVQTLLDKYNVDVSYYAHAGAGELHVEPMINLKSAEGLKLFRLILAETVKILKKYKGSLSGEHGDGRLRGEFISVMTGEETFNMFRTIKNIFDPKNVFNKGKIIDTPPMDSNLRVEVNRPPAVLKTYFDFSRQDGLLRLAEKCSGSGDCRRTEISGGTMCPSYMATRMEKDTTRARANVLRQFLSNATDPHPLDHEEIKEVMDLCVSCKGCKIECPSGVDITKMKAEFLQNYYDQHGIPFRSRLIGNFSRQMKLASIMPGIYNLIFSNPVFRSIANRLVGFHPQRSIPLLPGRPLRHWFNKRKKNKSIGRKVYLFCDEFTNYYDVDIGKKTVLLLEALGYSVTIPDHHESGRTYLSKGLVKKAMQIARKNIEVLSSVISLENPLIGIEPSAVLTIRDEYLDLSGPELKQKAVELAENTFTIEEFMSGEIAQGVITKEKFTRDHRRILVHGHCYQKALSSHHSITTMLSLPENYQVTVIPSGCCGMAGSFGYEREHYEVSNQIGELVLFPIVREQPADTIIAASGTSCRHQIKDGTKRIALHPVEIMFNSLIG